MVKITMLVLLLPGAEFAFSQKQTCNWYFGNQAAVSFCAGSPVNMGGSVMNTSEGSASVSDANGDLLFYTNGVEVYNKQNQLMPNGTGLMGHPSSTHSAVIIPHPGNSNLYFVFTSDAGPYANPPNDGFRYSVVDMTLDNGNGDVLSASKNILLMDSCTEKIAATRHGNGTGYWVLTHRWNSNAFYAFEVTQAGVNAVPVISYAGSIHSGNHDNTIGQMKISPQGNKLALAVNISGFFEVFNFDNLTGSVSNPIKLQIPQFISAYGVEFSASGLKLYVTTNFFPSVYQYDLTSGIDSLIIASQTVIGSAPNGIINGSLQLAPDGKIYLAHESGTQGHPYLSIIQNPESAGMACGFNYNGFSLGLARSHYGLPSFPSHYLLPVGVPEPNWSSGFSSYFHDGSVYIEWNSGQADRCILTVYDPSGRLLHSLNINEQRGTNFLRLSLHNVASGIYIVSLIRADALLQKKIGLVD